MTEFNQNIPYIHYTFTTDNNSKLYNPRSTNFIIGHHFSHSELQPATPAKNTYLGKVYGLRIYTQEDAFLSGGFGKRWYSPRQKAKCDCSYGKPPHANKLCGINMFILTPYIDIGEFLSVHDLTGIAAITEGWGKVIKMRKFGVTSGYRLEQALVTHVVKVSSIVSRKDPFRISHGKRIDFGEPTDLPEGWIKKGVKVIESEAELQDVIASRTASPLSSIPESEAKG